MSDKAEHHLTGVAVSRGIGVGPVVFYTNRERNSLRKGIAPSEIETELARFRSALTISTDQLRSLIADGASGRPMSAIFDVHLAMLEDPSLIHRIERTISEQKTNAEYAIKLVASELGEIQAAAADARFREKNLDIDDVAERLMSALHGSEPANIAEGSVVAAQELSPASIVEIQKFRPAAIITERGGWTSHSAIIARELKLPMVCGLREIDKIPDADAIALVDGNTGEVILNPYAETQRSYKTGMLKPELKTGRLKPGLKTLDGTKIVIRANVDNPAAYAAAEQNGAEGIGLYRSESLITADGVIPTEDEQAAVYSKLAAAAGDLGVKIRTFDIGVDQLASNGTAERNPALGLRAIRLSLADQAIFRTQISAILRSSIVGKIDIVLPMISAVDEVIRAKTIIGEEKTRLTTSGIAVGNPRVGAMIEVPSAVLTAGDIVRETDFLCLGTNDLVQYLLAADRDNDTVADWYQTLHPAVIRAIGEVVDAATSVIVCGEMAGSPFYVPLLIGLGARELSMNPTSIPHVRHLISGIELEDCKRLLESIKKLRTAANIESALQDYYSRNWKHVFPKDLIK